MALGVGLLYSRGKKLRVVEPIDSRKANRCSVLIGEKGERNGLRWEVLLCIVRIKVVGKG